MGQLIEEVKIWNTPLVGAYLVWEFTYGYNSNHPTGDSPLGLLHFIAMAILTNQKLSDPISNRRNSIQSYVRSFEESKNSDILIGLQRMILEKRMYTLKSIDIATAEGLVVWDTNSGKVFARKLTKAPRRGNTIKYAIKKDGERARILGKWFAQNDLHTIASHLKIVL